MPTYRLTWRHPRAVPRLPLLEDVDADDVLTEGSKRLVLVADVVMFTATVRTVVVRRVDANGTQVECLCPRRQAG